MHWLYSTTSISQPWSISGKIIIRLNNDDLCAGPVCTKGGTVLIDRYDTCGQKCCFFGAIASVALFRCIGLYGSVLLKKGGMSFVA
jgi:hypothetical protein